jgi:HAD superfamily hydrolase (TIGR01509 family)
VSSVDGLDGVLFDLDGTLLDSEPHWFAAEHALAQRYDAHWTDADAASVVGSDLLVSARVMKQKMSLPLTDEQIVDFLVEAVSAAVHREVPWRPGARELLLDVSAAGIPCALVTMSYARIVEPVLAHVPDGTFGAVVTGDTVSHGKPHPEPYLRAMSLLGARPEHCVAVEDSPTGAASAEAAGVHVVVVPNIVEVPGGPGRTVLTSLAGITVADLNAFRDVTES